MEIDVEDVEIKLALWCCSQKLAECTCPKYSELLKMPYEALERLCKALTSETYTGNWKDFLEPQEAAKEPS